MAGCGTQVAPQSKINGIHIPKDAVKYVDGETLYVATMDLEVSSNIEFVSDGIDLKQDVNGNVWTRKNRLKETIASAKDYQQWIREIDYYSTEFQKKAYGRVFAEHKPLQYGVMFYNQNAADTFIAVKFSDGCTFSGVLHDTTWKEMIIRGKGHQHDVLNGDVDLTSFNPERK